MAYQTQCWQQIAEMWVDSAQLLHWPTCLLYMQVSLILVSYENNFSKSYIKFTFKLIK